MFAVQFERFGPPGVLAVGSAPEPRPGPHQVRIAARTAAVSPSIWGCARARPR